MRVWQAKRAARVDERLPRHRETTLDGCARAARRSALHSSFKRPENATLDFSPFGLDGYFAIRVPAPTPPCTSRTEPLRSGARRGQTFRGALRGRQRVRPRLRPRCRRGFRPRHLGQPPAEDGERHLASPGAGRPAGEFGYIKNAGAGQCSSRRHFGVIPRRYAPRARSARCSDGGYGAGGTGSASGGDNAIFKDTSRARPSRTEGGRERSCPRLRFEACSCRQGEPLPE